MGPSRRKVLLAGAAAATALAATAGTLAVRWCPVQGLHAQAPPRWEARVVGGEGVEE